MTIQVHRTEFAEVENLQGMYRQEANCQIIGDSALRRGLAEPYLAVVDGRVAGYGAVWTSYDPGRCTEFYVLPHLRAYAQQICRELLATSSAKQIGAQTNIPSMVIALFDFCTDITAEAVLFGDGFTSNLTCPGVEFRKRAPEDPTHPEGTWVLDAEGSIVAAGGFLTHYNPPYGDVYMEVAESARQRGYGSYMVQEVKRVCYEAGKKPAARCNASNTASRKTLQRAGLLPVGRYLVGKVSLD